MFSFHHVVSGFGSSPRSERFALFQICSAYLLRMWKTGMWTRLAAAFLCPAAVHAQDATWMLDPGSGDFNTAANWTPPTVPVGIAIFNDSSVVALTISSATTIQELHFTAAAPVYSFNLTNDLTINGNGIVSDSVGVRPTFATNGRFFNSAMRVRPARRSSPPAQGGPQILKTPQQRAARPSPTVVSRNSLIPLPLAMPSLPPTQAAESNSMGRA
jgi:hypothetical protein